jgi:hypothetical protein
MNSICILCGQVTVSATCLRCHEETLTVDQVFARWKLTREELAVADRAPQELVRLLRRWVNDRPWDNASPYTTGTVALMRATTAEIEKWEL